MENKRITNWFEGCFIILASASYIFISLSRLGTFEFVSSDEFVSIYHALNFSQNFPHPKVFYWVSVTQRMPFAYLFILPIAWLSRFSEITLRLPNIAFGVALIPLCAYIAKKLFSRSVAMLTVLLYVSSGIFAVNRLTIGISNCIFFIMLAFLMIYNAGQKNNILSNRHIVYGALCLLIANLTFQDVIMFSFGGIIVIYLLSHQLNVQCDKWGKNIILFCGVCWGGLFLYYLLSIIVYSGYNYIVHQSIDLKALGTIAQYVERTKNGIVSNNFLPYLKTYVSHNSLLHSIVLTVGGICAILTKKKNVRLLLSYSIFHILAWMFIMPDRLFEHPLFTLPILCIVSSVGYIEIFSRIRAFNRYAAYALLGAIIIGSTISYCWNYSYFNDINMPNKRRVTAHGMMKHAGFKTAGYVIRDITKEEKPVWIFQPELLKGIGYYSNRKVIVMHSPTEITAIQEGIVLLKSSSSLNAIIEQHFPYRISIKTREEIVLNLFFKHESELQHSPLISYDTMVYDRRWDTLFNSTAHYNNL